MPTQITMPDVGAGVEAARVSCWLVNPGETVREGDRLVEISVRGVTFDVAAPCTGTLTRIERLPPREVATGEILGWIE